MEKNIVKIIWADDEIDSLLDDIVEKTLRDKCFEVIGKAHNSDELKALLYEKHNQTNAVIVDANFCEYGTPCNEFDTSGLDSSRSLHNNLYCHIPFFLFTARPDAVLKKKYEINCSPVLRDFPRYKRWFSKSITDEFDQMLTAIRDEVELFQTAEYIVANRFKKELESAVTLLDKKRYDILFDLLVRDYNNTLMELEDPFNGLRKILEMLFIALKKNSIVPPLSEMNGIATYLCYNNPGRKSPDYGKYNALKKDLLPRALAFEVVTMTKLIQDGCHVGDKMVYVVDEYWTRSKDANFLRIILWTVVSLLKWTEQICSKYPNPAENEGSLWTPASPTIQNTTD